MPQHPAGTRLSSEPFNDTSTDAFDDVDWTPKDLLFFATAVLPKNIFWSSYIIFSWSLMVGPAVPLGEIMGPYATG